MAEATNTNRNLQDFQVRKLELANRTDSRVIIARTKDLDAILGIARSADRALNYLRRNAGLRFDFSEVEKHVSNFRKVLMDFYRVTKEMCDAAGTTFRAPAWLREMAGDSVEQNEEKEEVS